MASRKQEEIQVNPPEEPTEYTNGIMDQEDGSEPPKQFKKKKNRYEGPIPPPLDLVELKKKTSMNWLTLRKG